MLCSWPRYPAFITFRFGVSLSPFLWHKEREFKPFLQTGKPAVQSTLEPACSAQPSSYLCPQDPQDDVTALCLHGGGGKRKKNPPLGSPELGKGQEESRPATVSPALLSGCLEVQILLFPGRKYPCLVSTPRRIFVESLRKIPSRWESEKSLCLSLLEKKGKNILEAWLFLPLTWTLLAWPGFPPLCLQRPQNERHRGDADPKCSSLCSRFLFLFFY